MAFPKHDGSDDDFAPSDQYNPLTRIQGANYTNVLDPYFMEYDMDYYTASQCGVYIGDILIDEIVRIGWSHVQSKTPIFSYASNFFETVAWGQEIVQGSLAINFKENAYLQIVLSNYAARNGQTPVTTDAAGGHVNFALTARNNIEKILRDQQIKTFKDKGINNYDEIVAENEYQILEQIYGFADMRMNEGQEIFAWHLQGGDGNMSPGTFAGEGDFNERASDFEQIAETLENQIWKENLSVGGGVGSGQLTVPTHSDGFNIYITYGDYDNPAANHTGKKITEVHLTSQGQQLQIDGQPIFEVYDFIARGVDISG